MSKLLRKRYRAFSEQKRVGYWDKVLKRYFNIAAKLKDPFLEGEIEKLLYSVSSLRSSIFRYLLSIGWSQNREEQILKYLSNALDDESFFGAIDVLLRWTPLSNVQYATRMKQLARNLGQGESVLGFIGGLWIIAKYGNDTDIATFTTSTINIWRSNEWLARQIAALWPKIKAQTTKENIRNVINSFA